MTRETYRKMTGYFLQDEKKVRRIILANRLLTGIVFVSYPLYLISLLLKRDTLLPQAVLVPAVSFVVVTLFRKIVNEPRPYEKYDLPPVIDKDAGGKSFQLTPDRVRCIRMIQTKRKKPVNPTSSVS